MFTNPQHYGMQSSSNSHENSSDENSTNKNVSDKLFTDKQELKSARAMQPSPVINCIMSDKIVFHTG